MFQDFLNSTQETEYVDAHGRPIRVVYNEKTGEILIPLDELRQTGFKVFRRKQYSKLLVDDKQYLKEFNLHLLSAAQTFILENKVKFNENDILESINNCRKILSGEKDNDTSGFQEFATSNFSSTPKTVRVEEMPLTAQNLRKHDDTMTTSSPSFHSQQNGTISKQDFNTIDNSQTRNKFNEQKPERFGQQRENKFMQMRRDNTEEFGGNQPKRFDENQQKRNSFPKRNFQNTPSVENNQKPKFLPRRNQDNSKEGSEDGSRNSNQNQRSRGPRESLPTVELIENELNEVMVSVIEKRNCVWVQCIDNVDILKKILDKCSEEGDNAARVFKPVFNKMYMALDEGSWFRCCVRNSNPLTVFYVDYGNISEVDEVREIPEKLSEIPGQAARICFSESHYDPVEGDTIKVKPVKRFDDKTYYCQIRGKNSVKSSTSKTYSTVPSSLIPLQMNQRVMVIGYENEKLYLRTKECVKKLREIKELIKKTVLEDIEKIQRGQLVLVQNPNPSNLDRALVVSTNHNSAEVKLIDYGTAIEVPLTSIKTITEELSHEPVTCIITPTLEGYDNKAFCEKSKSYLEQLIQNETKCTVMLSENSKFNLLIDNETLTQKFEKLKQIDAPKNFVSISNLSAFKPDFGVSMYTCYSVRSLDHITFVNSEEIEKHIGDIIKSEIEDLTPYKPQLKEVCWGLYEGCWWRCVVNHVVSGNEFEVSFIDFGNLEVLTSDELRKLTDDVKNIPILGLTCRLTGLPNNPSVNDLFRKYLVENEDYEVKIKAYNNNKYDIEIDSVTKDLQAALS